MKKYQFIKWLPIWKGFSFEKPFGGISLIYDWSLSLGFWEIRKWHELKEGEMEEYNKGILSEAPTADSIVDEEMTFIQDD